MGSLESNTGHPLKRESHQFRSLSTTATSGGNRSIHFHQQQRPATTKSRLSRFFLLKKLDYLLWICSVAVFLSFLLLFHFFLPSSVLDDYDSDLNASSSSIFWKDDRESSSFRDGLLGLKEFGVLDFGDDFVKFKPLRVLDKLRKEARDAANFFNNTRSFGFRKPNLALVFADLLADPQQLLMVTVAAALQEIGYSIEIYALSDGPAHGVWNSLGVTVTIFQVDNVTIPSVDWLNYDGILVDSLEAKVAFSCFMQEPFKSVPLIWTIHEDALAFRSRQYASNGRTELLNDWKKVFSRASIVVFPNHLLPMLYSMFDVGNYHVIPGSPASPWEANGISRAEQNYIRQKMGYGPRDIVITIVGSQFSYKGLWLEHALILNALLPMFQDHPFDEKQPTYHLKILVLCGYAATNYSTAIEAIASNLSYPKGAVKHIAIDGNGGSVLNIADVVVYGSFLEEHIFPESLLKAMCMGKPIVAPKLSMIEKYVDDRVNGFLFPKENVAVLRQILKQLITRDRLSPLAQTIASVGRGSCKNLMVEETVEGYALLLENILKLPSEVAVPKAVTKIPTKCKEEWHWSQFEKFISAPYKDRTLRSSKFLDKVEEQWSRNRRENSGSILSSDQSFVYEIWEEEKNNEILNSIKKREEEEIRDRTDQPRGTWEDVYRSAKRADRLKNELHERDDGELERTGQPLCIYEPYYGEGTWSFLHLSSLYRGIGLSTKGKRPRHDDVDAPSRLPLLNNPYYRDVLGEHGAFFAIANRIDRVHKNAWIGFQSWRATARKESLSRIAETALLGAIQARAHGDALYFWVRMDADPRFSSQQDFWESCDAISAGNCRSAFSEALKQIYGIKNESEFIPPMPKDGDTWSVMLSWALPTRSFEEYVMFSRMFIDSLDAQMYDEHHRTGRCSVSLYKDKHCYSPVLEVLINIWAYHSVRRMVYVNPKTGLMQEQHKFKSRRGKMWIKWFSYTTLKSMDEELAEVADSDPPKKRWLWPSTGEIVWSGTFEKERALRLRQKEKKKQESKEKLNRMRKRHHQKVIGKYIKPPPDDDRENRNSTITVLL